MTIRSSPNISRPDGVQLFGGQQGETFDQDNLKIIAKPAPSSEADIDVDHDVVNDGDYDSGIHAIDGTGSIGFSLTSEDNNSFEVKVENLDDNDNVRNTVDSGIFSDLAGTDVNTSIPVFSDKVRVIITDTSGGNDNTVSGSINANSGGPSTQTTNVKSGDVKVQGSDGDNIVDEHLNNPVSDSSMSLLTYLSRALVSRDLDHFQTLIFADNPSNSPERLNVDGNGRLKTDASLSMETVKLDGDDDDGNTLTANAETLSQDITDPDGIITYPARALQQYSIDQLRVDLENNNIGNIDQNLSQVGGTGQSGVDVANKIQELADALQAAFAGDDQLRVDLENDNVGLAQNSTLTNTLSRNLAQVGGTSQTGVDIANKLQELADALQSQFAGDDQLRVDLENNNAGTINTEQQSPVGIENEAGEQVDPDSADAAYANSITLSSGGEETFGLVARGGDDIVGRVVSDGQYSIEARYKNDSGSTVFTETVASNVSANTTTELGPNDTVVDPASDHVTIAVTEGSGSDSTLDVVLHYN